MCINEWGDIGLILSWEATYARCRGPELKAGSQPTTFGPTELSFEKKNTKK